MTLSGHVTCDHCHKTVDVLSDDDGWYRVEIAGEGQHGQRLDFCSLECMTHYWSATAECEASSRP